MIRVERDEDTIASITQSVVDVAGLNNLIPQTYIRIQQQVNNNDEEEILWT